MVLGTYKSHQGLTENQNKYSGLQYNQHSVAPRKDYFIFDE